MTTTIRNLITDTWDSLFGRVLLIGVAFGWASFWLLSEAVSVLN